MKKLALFLLLGPLYPLPAAAITYTNSPSAYMVENTTGTDPSGNACYDFQTSPTCRTFIANISSGSIAGGSTNYIQNTLSPTTAMQVFSVSTGVINTFMGVGSSSALGQTQEIARMRAATNRNFDFGGAASLSAGVTMLSLTDSNTLAPLQLRGSQFYWAASDGNIGINNTNPTTLMHISSGVLTVDGNGGGIVSSSITTSFINNVAVSKSPTVQKFTSGSGTYTTPTNPSPVYIVVMMVGGGGGGSGSGTTGAGNGNTGTASVFGLSISSAGVGAVFQGTGAAGGIATLGAGAIGTAFTGGIGGGPFQSTITGSGTNTGGMGGATPLGGGARSAGLANGGATGAANTGEGGQGGSSATTGVANDTGSGGGAGGYINAIIGAPNSSYTYTVGTGGGGGSAGTSGTTGGAGATGYIEVREFYH